MKEVIVIGSGFSGLAAASCLAEKGYKVKVLEKNDSPGGRARKFKAEGFTFDMGPSWYWMPEVFEEFFNRFGKKVSDYYDLVRLDPSYRIYYKDDKLEVPAEIEDLYVLFDQIEPGSSEKLKQFLEEAKYKYEVGMNEFVWKPSHSILEFMDLRIAKSALKLDMFSSISKQVRKLFKNPKLIQLLEFPVLFLGATPQKTPALYSLMNYADLNLGTWYPMGGMHKIIDGMISLAEELGVEILCNQNVTQIDIEKGAAKRVLTETDVYECDFVVGSADYRHIEQELIPKAYRKYSAEYWDKRELAPSSLLYYIGVNKKLKSLKHHNLFFDKDFDQHAKDIYEEPKWPSDPLFYVCVPSVTDDSVAPDGMENVFLLMPLAPDLEDNEEIREKYFNIMIERLEEQTGESIRGHIIYKRSYGIENFKSDYNAFKGNAYGLANTLRQTAFLKPKMKSNIKNVFYTGQLTTPGPGVPPSLISGQVVAQEILKQ
ncbi:phytoene desaturase family protein [Portibacter lacus]|uniref:Phytoene dehydrogenase n=1 Tax=Portibacter lacus TaxID=1099794 RepID=A0AA37SPT6_9BACT|nr:phytoene desaturase family protein [Portibacter lacus]GLR17659.1 phytoene dehydrogenase [Portibacter lacus]